MQKKQPGKIKTFITKHEREIERFTYYAIGAVVGLAVGDIVRKKSYDQFSSEHPEIDLVLKDRNGDFYGFNPVKEEPTED